MRNRDMLLLSAAILAAAVTYAQPSIRLVEDLRSVRSEIVGHSNRTSVPDPLFEDVLVDLGDRFVDAGGRIEGVVAQSTKHFDQYQHVNEPERGHRLWGRSDLKIHGAGHPAHDTLVLESIWVLRFELLQPCTIEISPGGFGYGDYAAEFRLRRFNGSAWVTIYEYVTGQPGTWNFLAALTDLGSRYELVEISRLRGQAPVAPGSNSSDFRMVVDFTPLGRSGAQEDSRACPDFDASDAVDLTDLSILLAAFGSSGGEPYCVGDCDGDGDVELDDLSLLLAAFGEVCR